MIVPSHFTPLASLGIIRQGIKWLFDSKSPFYIKPSLNRQLVQWGIQFVRKANSKNAEYAAPHLRDLSLLSHSLYKELSLAPGFDFSLEEKGILMYFKTERAAEEEIHLAGKARSLGLDAVQMTRQEVQILEPTVELDILGAIHYRCDAHLYPNKLMPQLRSYIIQNGGLFEFDSEVVNMHVSDKKIVTISTRDKEIEGDVFVAAGGSWLPQILKMAGVYLPLMPGKGYSVTDPEPRIKLNIPAILCEARVAITPMNGMMRYGGTMELAAINDTINMNRVNGMLTSIPKYFPNLKPPLPDAKNIWYGFRPCSADGLPYIGWSGISNMIIAGGHSMMGLALGPATGKIVADMCNQRSPDLSMEAFDPARFS